MQDIKNLSLKEIEAALVSWAIKPFHVRQIFSWIYKKGALSFEQMSDLPKELRDKLEKEFYIAGIELIKVIKSADGTQKFLFKLKDANYIEAVIIPTETRVTFCLSTQAGCKFACKFCASGLLGFKRNLTCSEILEQILILNRHSKNGKATHIVFMGTGEPLDNYQEVMKAIKMINSSVGLNIGARRITISTCGIIPAIQKLAGQGLQIELSVSLHAANDKLRSALMPINKKYPLKELIRACKDYSSKTNRQVTFEYILLKGLNSSLEDAENLGRILKDYKLAKVNLIPSNYISELKVQPPGNTDIRLFKGYLVKQNINTTLRKERGEDINAACGQLRLSYAKK